MNRECFLALIPKVITITCMEILAKILGSEARVKIMRLFLLNRGKGFKSKDIVLRSRVPSSAVGRELRLLSSVDFIKKRSSASGEWYFNSSFKYTREFEDLLVMSNTFDRRVIVSHFKKAGRLKLVLIAGVFIKNEDSRVDLLIVGEGIKPRVVEEGVKRLEALIGTEIAYAVFDKKEFIYRVSMYDKLVRDILDFPHEVVVESPELNLEKLARHVKHG